MVVVSHLFFFINKKDVIRNELHPSCSRTIYFLTALLLFSYSVLFKEISTDISRFTIIINLHPFTFGALLLYLISR